MASDGTIYLVVAHNTQFKDGEMLQDLLFGEIYRSRNGGDSWEKIEIPESVRFPNSIEIDPGNPNQLYLACWGDITRWDYGSFPDLPRTIETDGGVWSSEDGGEIWKQIFDELEYVYGVTVDSYHPGRLYLNTFQNAAYRSDDSGNTWKKIRGYDFKWGHRVIVDEYNPEYVYLTTFGGSVFYGKPVTE
jgi:hypothetical protein